jgi:predicted ATP-dependent serine protease
MSDKITCPQCGQELDEGTTKCFQCGADTNLPEAVKEPVKEEETGEQGEEIKIPVKDEDESQDAESEKKEEETTTQPVGEVAGAVA